MQLKEPSLLTHSELTSHSETPVAHSSTSSIEKRNRQRKEKQSFKLYVEGTLRLKKNHLILCIGLCKRKAADKATRHGARRAISSISTIFHEKKKELAFQV